MTDFSLFSQVIESSMICMLISPVVIKMGEGRFFLKGSDHYSDYSTIVEALWLGCGMFQDFFNDLSAISRI